MPLNGGETELVDRTPKDGSVVGVEDNLAALDGGTRSTGHAVDRLTSDETGKLVEFLEALIVGEDSRGELADGRGVANSQTTKVEAAFCEARGGLCHHDAGQCATGNLIGSEDCTAIEFGAAGDVHLDHTEVGLDESVVNTHLGGEVFEPFAEHTAEEFEDGTEVSPLGADVHLTTSAQRNVGLGRGFTHNGADTGLTVDERADFAADFGVDSENFSHSYLVLVG